MDEPIDKSSDLVNFESHVQSHLDKGGWFGVDLAEIPEEVISDAEKNALKELCLKEVPKA